MKHRILFVDDDVRFLDGLKRMLRAQRADWDMTFVGSVDEGLVETRKNHIDVVVADVKMPGKDGFDLLKEINLAKAETVIPVIILTGAGEEDLKRRALDLGATDLLTKPVSREDLLARIGSTLRLKVSQDKLRDQNETLEAIVKERTAELEESRFDIVWHLAKAGEYRDEETGNHIARVGCCSRVLAERLGMPLSYVELIFVTSPLHDIGKIGIPDSILLKKGKLSPEEWKVMKRHCAIGAKILREKPRGMKPFLSWRLKHHFPVRALGEHPILDVASTIAMTHHEKWDGSGYPQGLKGEAIPLEARIVAVSDVYDALRSDRPYKQAYPADKALGIMREQVGRHFGPAVFEAFEKEAEQFEEIRTELSD